MLGDSCARAAVLKRGGKKVPDSLSRMFLIFPGNCMKKSMKGTKSKNLSAESHNQSIAPPQLLEMLLEDNGEHLCLQSPVPGYLFSSPHQLLRLEKA